MIGITTNFNNLAIKFVANTPHLAVQLSFVRLLNKWLAVLGTKHNVNVILYERLSHNFIVLHPFGAG
jgi:hypothetical protein